VRIQTFRTGKTVTVGFGLVLRSANGVGSRFRATTNRVVFRSAKVRAFAERKTTFICRSLPRFSEISRLRLRGWVLCCITAFGRKMRAPCAHLRLTASRRRLRGIRVEYGLRRTQSPTACIGRSRLRLASDAVAYGLHRTQSPTACVGRSRLRLASDAVAYGLRRTQSPTACIGRSRLRLASDAVAYGLHRTQSPTACVGRSRLRLASDVVAYGLPLNDLVAARRS
jgi:hypothetical protein